MAKGSTKTGPAKRTSPAFLRAIVEIAFIIFLFYSNLLMGEFIHSNQSQGKSLLQAMADVFTAENFLIALFSAVIGYFVFEFLRKKL